MSNHPAQKTPRIAQSPVPMIAADAFSIGHTQMGAVINFGLGSQSPEPLLEVTSRIVLAPQAARSLGKALLQLFPESPAPSPAPAPVTPASAAPVKGAQAAPVAPSIPVKSAPPKAQKK